MPTDAFLLLPLVLTVAATLLLPSPHAPRGSDSGGERQAITETVADRVGEELFEIEKAAKVSALEEKVGSLEHEVEEAQARLDDAQRALDEEPEIGEDPGTNEGHPEWTALGLYRHILDNTGEDNPEHWDAQAAIDILGGGYDSTGHDYDEGNGPVPDGRGSVPADGISSHIDFSNRADATSLDNLVASVDWIDEYNRCRGKENETMGTDLPTDIGLNCRLMAVSAVHLDVSCDPNDWMEHCWIYGVGENLAWGYSNPFDGWYDEEKGEYLATGSVSGHHYFDIVDGTTQAVGFATSQYGSYRVAYEQSFHLSYSPGYPSVTYTTDEFRERWLTPYYEEQIRSGMHGFTEEQHAEHDRAVDEARARLDETTAELEAAKSELAAARARTRESAA